MTETTRPTECSAPTATLYLALELGSTKWQLALTPTVGQRPRLKLLAAGDLRALLEELEAAKVRFGLAPDVPMQEVMRSRGHTEVNRFGKHEVKNTDLLIS